MANYDSIDLAWNWDGDFVLGNDGDLADTSDDLIRSLENEIATLVKSETADWQKHPTFAIDLSDFLGEANTKESGERIEDRIRLKLISTKLVLSSDLGVRVVPIGPHEILIIIAIEALATPGNRLVFGESVVVKLLYDTIEDGIFFLPIDQTERRSR